MPIRFNTLLKEAEVDPKRVRLIRHQDNRASTVRSPYLMWRDHPAEFMAYQSEQSRRVAAALAKADFWAVFVVTPAKETLFAGLYQVGPSKPVNATEDVVFQLVKSIKLAEFEKKLVIDWGPGFLAWNQRADNQDKVILELRTKFVEETYPGHLHFIKRLSEIETLPNGWTAALKAVQGIYILACPKTGQHYIGSATSEEGGFFGRWCQHARKGGDAVQLQSRTPSDYQVSILEVAASNATNDEIVRLEHVWMRKLLSTQIGLNTRAGESLSNTLGTMASGPMMGMAD